MTNADDPCTNGSLLEDVLECSVAPWPTKSGPITLHEQTSDPPGVDQWPTMKEGRKEKFLFNDTLNTFYLWLYGATHGKGPFR